MTVFFHLVLTFPPLLSSLLLFLSMITFFQLTFDHFSEKKTCFPEQQIRHSNPNLTVSPIPMCTSVARDCLLTFFPPFAFNVCIDSLSVLFSSFSEFTPLSTDPHLRYIHQGGYVSAPSSCGAGHMPGGSDIPHKALWQVQHNYPWCNRLHCSSTDLSIWHVIHSNSM